MQSLLGKHRVKSQEVAILTPYSAQKIVIQNELKMINLDCKVKVATISESQGNKQMKYLLKMFKT